MFRLLFRRCYTWFQISARHFVSFNRRRAISGCLVLDEFPLSPREQLWWSTRWQPPVLLGMDPGRMDPWSWHFYQAESAIDSPSAPELTPPPVPYPSPIFRVSIWMLPQGATVWERQAQFYEEEWVRIPPRLMRILAPRYCPQVWHGPHNRIKWSYIIEPLDSSAAVRALLDTFEFVV